MRTIKIFILAAGVGSRAKYLTDGSRNKYPMAKPRFALLETPVMDHWVREAKRIGVKKVSANLWSNPQTITDYYEHFGDARMQMVFHNEPTLMGTMGSAVHWARQEGVKDDDLIFILSGDIACNANLQTILDEHLRADADLTVAFDPAPWSQIKKFGTAAFEGLPPKRSKRAAETAESYASYLMGYQKEVDEFVRKNAYQGLRVTDFKEKVGPEECCSNCNNASIYLATGRFINALAKHGITPVDDRLPDAFYDFGKHGFRFALEHRFKFYGVILPDEVYYMDVGDMGKFWLAIMDTLDGTFDRSMWGLLPKRDERIAFIHPSAYVSPDAELIAPYYIGRDAEVQASAKVGPYGFVCSHGLVKRNAVITGGAMLETAHYYQGDQVRMLDGNERGGAELKRSLLASGVLSPREAGQNNVVFIRPDGRQRFAPMGMDRELSESKINGVKVGAVER